MTNKITYLQAGEHRVPNLTIPYQPKLNKYALMRKKFLKEHRPSQYTTLLLTGELSSHLFETGKLAQLQVNSIMEQLGKQMAAPESGNSIEMTAFRNTLLQLAEEQVLPETIYA